MADDLVISIGSSIRDLERQMRGAAKLAEQRAEEIEATFRKANPTIGGDFGLGVLKGAIAAISFEKITRGFIEANREIASFGETARRVGLDVAKFQELRLAAQGEGISGKTFDSGIDGLAKKLNEARTEESELSKLFDANNVKLKTRTGEVISSNQALNVAADLISRAATEQDRIAIAEKFGLPADFVPLLERGAGALGELARKAGEAGSILDSDVIAKAKQFDDAWNGAWAAFASNSKAAIIGAAQGLAGLLSQVGVYLAKVDEANRKQSQVPERAALRGKAMDMALGNAGGRDVLDAARAAAAREARAQFIASEKDRSVTAPVPPSRPTRNYMGDDVTKLPPSKTGGGGGGGKSEEEAAQDRLDRYIESLVRQRAVMEAEAATVGKSNAERKAAVEIAKAQVELDKLGTEEKAKYIEKLTEEVGKNEEVRASRDRLQAAQKGMIEAQRYFGDAAVDALEDLIINGEKAEDVIKNLTKSLAKAAMQALLMGNGPLAGLFGTAGANGAAGGLFGAIGGSIFKRGGGGPVNAGQAYDIGEHGRERFVPMSPGRIIPNSKLGGGVSISPTYAIDARGSQMSEGQFRQILAENNAQLRSQVPGLVHDAQRRGGA